MIETVMRVVVLVVALAFVLVGFAIVRDARNRSVREQRRQAEREARRERWGR